jgi:hypothetical protein
MLLMKTPTRVPGSRIASKPAAGLVRVLALLTFLFLCRAPLATAADEELLPEEVPEATEESEADEPGEELLVGMEVPLLSPHFADTPVALVDEEPITFADLTRSIASTHSGKAEAETSVKKDYANLLDRIITTKLILLEARNIGLDELPEVATEIESNSLRLLVARLMAPQLMGLEPDEREVDDLYEKMSRELLLTALKFKREEDALAFEKEYESRGDFSAVAARFIDEGRAEGAIDGEQYLKLKDLLPEIAQAAFEMKPDSVSRIFKALGGYLVFYLHDVRSYEDPGVREEARQMLLKPLRKRKADEYVDLLIAKHCTVDEKLLEEVSFDQQTSGLLWWRKEEPVDFEKLRSDSRVLATVNTDEPIRVTVADVAAKIEERRFHGVEKAAELGKLDREKRRILRDMLFREAAMLEAAELGLDRDPEYLETREEFVELLLFDVFIKKVVAPDVKLTEEEVRAYYDEHLDDVSSPTMFRIDGLAFYKLRDAETALRKLRKKADFKWVSANSPGLVDKEAAEAKLFDSAILSLNALPEGLQRTAEGARKGEVLLYSSPEGVHYVLFMDDVFPPTAQPYQAARASMAKLVFEAKLKALIADWSGKLREAYETRIFVTGLEP